MLVHNPVSIDEGVIVGLLNLVMPVLIVCTSPSCSTVCKVLINAKATKQLARKHSIQESNYSRPIVKTTFRAMKSPGLSKSSSQNRSTNDIPTSTLGPNKLSVALPSVLHRVAPADAPCAIVHVRELVIPVEAGRCGGRLHTDIALQ
jgi:hypothetical protein